MSFDRLSLCRRVGAIDIIKFLIIHLSANYQKQVQQVGFYNLASNSHKSKTEQNRGIVFSRSCKFTLYSCIIQT